MKRTLLLNLSDENQKEPLNLIVFAFCHLIFHSCNSKESQLDMGGVGLVGGQAWLRTNSCRPVSGDGLLELESRSIRHGAK